MPIAVAARKRWPFAAGCAIAAALLHTGCARRVPAVTAPPPAAGGVPAAGPAAPAPASPLPAAGPSPPPVAAPAARSPAIERLARDIESITRGPGVKRAVWGIAVHSLDRDERLFEMNAATLLVPASVAKLLSVAAAVEAVGWDYRFETTLSTTGIVTNGTLAGDLIATGTGDPSIGGRGGDDMSVWIEALKGRGIRAINGRVIGDDDAVEEPRAPLSWGWDDLGYTSGTLFGALNYGENRMAITVTPGATVGSAAVLAADPRAPDRPLRNTTVTVAPGSAQFLWPEQRPADPALTIGGTMAAGAPPATMSVSAGNPTSWFAQVLRHGLIAAGIHVAGPAVDIDDLPAAPDRQRMTVLHVHRSRPLSEIVQPLMKESINMYAEAVMRLNAAGLGFPTNDAAIEGLTRRLVSWGVMPEGQQLIDGSGLSRRDLLSSELLVDVLRRTYDASGASPWMRALPVAGIDGSLDGRMKGTTAEGKVLAKTGTMSRVRSLAGYVTTADDERLAFSIIGNNFEGAGPVATQAVDAIAVKLAAFSRR